MPPKTTVITKLLLDLSGGNRSMIDELMPLVYAQLHNLAKKQLHHERQNHTLNATALVHEAFLKLVDQTQVNWQNRAHFFAIAAQAMRRILINYAKKRLAEKRGGDQPVVTLDENALVVDSRAEDIIALDEALERLAELNPRQAKVVECRFFTGLTLKEIAKVLGVSVATVQLDWRLAKAWLSRELKDKPSQ